MITVPSYLPPTQVVAQSPSYVPPATQTVVQRPSYVPPATQTVVQRPSYVPPPTRMVAQGPSYVAPPMPTMAFMPNPAMPARLPFPQAPSAPPQSLTAGIPDPTQIDRQKVAYAAALDKQLNDAIVTVQNETKIEKEMVAFKTQKEIALFEAQVDEKLVEMLAAADESAAVRTCQLKKASVERNIMLNNQASTLVMDYRLKTTLDDIARKKAAFEQTYAMQGMKLSQEFTQAAMRAGTVSAPMMYAAPPGVVV